jgi:nucleotide-binding universal stress UspA family protein
MLRLASVNTSTTAEEVVSAMYDRLLVAVDHSETAGRVINAAREMAALSHGEVWMLHVREKQVTPRTGSALIEPEAEAQSLAEDAARVLRGAGIKAHSVVRSTIHGQAAREIVRAARAHDAGIIVMGSRGHRDLTGLVLGGAAHEVIRLSGRPVLVVR